MPLNCRKTLSKWRKVKTRSVEKEQTLREMWERRWARPQVRRGMVLWQANQVTLN